MNYDFNKIENNWKDIWYEHDICRAEDFSDKPKKYILAELPYPSGYALHAGHMMRYTVPEVYSRYLRMQGYNVMFPMGWDAFGLPAETFAIKTGTHPSEAIEKAIHNFKDSLIRMGYGIDWSREINTSDPDYYKWTQWIFLKLWKTGLAEYREMPVWWCQELGVLADEEVLTDQEGNKYSERGGHKVERKPMSQWVLKIPEYADKLIKDLETVDYQDSVKTAQLNWIGRSEGALIKFPLSDGSILKVFTTRPDTICGVAFLAISPEHEIVSKLTQIAENSDEITEYVNKAKNLSDLEKQTKEKTGVLVKGVLGTNPFTGQDGIPVYISDYIINSYGTGSIMGVPGHDERDMEFAESKNLTIIKVIESPEDFDGVVYTGQGLMTNCGEYNGMHSADFSKVVINTLETKKLGEKETQYKIRDQVFSRQRYWGEPIPLIHTHDGKIEAVVDPDNMDEVRKSLPVQLPAVPDYNPTKDGSSPLAKNEEWVKTKDSKGMEAKRETDTMPTWAGSNWYYLRYIDPNNNQEFADLEKLKYWLPVDKYFGDSGHTTAHLLYSRFWHKFLFDQNLVPTSEPYQWRMSGGFLLGPDGNKMSKSKGNIVDPLTVVNNYGADATRVYLCFIGPYEDTYPWNENGIKACWRLVKNIYEMKDKVKENVIDEQTFKAFNKMLMNITGMIENLKMNTSISEIMIFVNHLKTVESIDLNVWKDFIKSISPFMPFVAEELWNDLHQSNWKPENSVHKQSWPKYNLEAVTNNIITLPIQINGRVRSEININPKATQEEAESLVKNDQKIQELLTDKTINKIIYVPGKIINLVVS